MARQYDLVVIGAGPAGQKGAVQAAKLKKSVAIIEKEEHPGGICLYTGTLPSKTLRESVMFYQGFRKRLLRGVSCRLDKATTLTDLMYQKDTVIEHERGIISDQLMRNDVQVLRGHASFVDANHIAVTGPDGGRSVLEARYILIATGSRPIHQPYVPAITPPIFDSDTILQINRIPRTLMVLGAGVIGCEYACIFAALGTKVTLMDRRKSLLKFMDEEITAALSFHMRDMGTTLKLGEEVESVEVLGDEHVRTKFKSGKTVFTEALLSSMGRVAATDGLNLSAIGISEESGGHIAVNGHYQTAVPHVYAAGDVMGFPSLASASMDQGRLAVCHMFGYPAASFPNVLPYGVYTIPEISVVGQTEQELTEQCVPYETGVARLREIARGQIIGETEGLLKLIFHQHTREVLGVHVIGEGATELVHIGQAVMAHKGTIEYFVHNVFNYPTLAEAYKVAALNGLNKLQV